MTVRVYCMYGLGGRIWSSGMEDLVAANLRKIPAVHVDPTRGFTQWREIVDDIKKHKGDKFVVAGHSMGAAAATYVTDYVHVDLVICYDCAGQMPSPIGKNCERLLDFQDIGFDFNPNFRPRTVAGYEDRIERFVTRDGHVAQDDDTDLMRRAVAAVKKLTI